MLTSDIYAVFQDGVRTFVRAMNQDENAYPSRSLLELRWSLIEEEMKELREEYIKYQDETKDGDLVSREVAMQIMKELTDLEYVTAGYGVALGYPIVPAVERECSFENTYGFRSHRLIANAFERLEMAVQDAYLSHKKAVELCQPNTSVTPLVVYLNFCINFSYLTEAIINFAEACGINLVDTFVVVQESNMSKLGDDGKPIYREDGKVLKGPNYHKPDMSVFLENRKDVMV